MVSDCSVAVDNDVGKMTGRTRRNYVFRECGPSICAALFGQTVWKLLNTVYSLVWTTKHISPGKSP